MALAPPVSRDGFSFVSGELFAEVSGHNRHRRANVIELKEHFSKPGSDRDHPAPWFEAQLIHYGLPPSKTKSVARMRLFDAVNSGKLAVPAAIKALEAELKKEWMKSDREAKKAVKTAAAAGTKRKAESSNVDLTLNVGGINITVSANAASSAAVASSAKKSKTSETSTASTKAASNKDDDPDGTSYAVILPRRPAIVYTVFASREAREKDADSTPGWISQGPSRGNTYTSTRTAPPAADIRGVGTPGSTPRSGLARARHSRPFHPGGRSPAPDPAAMAHDWNGDDDDLPPPPPYREYEDEGGRSSDYHSGSYEDKGSSHNNYHNNTQYMSSSSLSSSSQPPYPALEPLGLLNGRYDMTLFLPDVSFATTHSHPLYLTLTLSGRELWGKFDLGAASGILRFETRPWESSHDALVFTWRGRGAGPYGDTDENEGYIRFLGGGRIEGELGLPPSSSLVAFRGKRLPGQGTRSDVDARSMRDE
ncbi:hypothetical protein F5Y17DRAFT_459809 [Xylariaceae sp. FL0594]|nr:hypothetical protein F5Y17DRAFT_459809 [Xylariaceae sp. FL0594]